MNSGAGFGEMRNDYSGAKRYWCWLLGVQGGLTAASFAGVLLPWPLASAVVGALGLAGSAFLFWLRMKADENYEHAEAIRRLTLLEDALGVLPDPADVARLVAGTTDRASDDPVPMGKYYNSDLRQGPRRLAHLLWESAHFTTVQARSVSQYCRVVAVTGAGSILLFFFVMLTIGSHSAHDAQTGPWSVVHGAKFAAAAGTLLTMFGLGTFAELARNFGSLASAAEITCRRCEALVLDAGTSLERVLFALEEYNCAMARTAPIPSYIWKRSQKKLTDSWTQASALVKS